MKDKLMQEFEKYEVINKASVLGGTILCTPTGTLTFKGNGCSYMICNFTDTSNGRTWQGEKFADWNVIGNTGGANAGGTGGSIG